MTGHLEVYRHSTEWEAQAMRSEGNSTVKRYINKLIPRLES